jgi:hypothetical protein
METFSLKELTSERDSWLFFAIIAMINDHGDELFKKNDSDKLNVEIKFNGVEVSFQSLIDRMIDSYNTSVNNTAFQLLKEKLGNIVNLASQIERDLTNVAADTLKINQDHWNG